MMTNSSLNLFDGCERYGKDHKHTTVTRMTTLSASLSSCRARAKQWGSISHLHATAQQAASDCLALLIYYYKTQFRPLPA